MSEEKNNDDNVLVGVDLTNYNSYNNFFSYENKDTSFKGEIKGYNYTNILRDKQTNIYKFYELATYYSDADEIISSLLKRILTPFSLSSGWKLKGISEKTKQKYIEHYEMIGFLDVARSIFYELYLYANCYIYFMPNGSLMTLPPHRIRIADKAHNGEPILEFNVSELNSRRTGVVKEKFIDTLLQKYEGYPPEITEELKNGTAGAWIQLDPKNTFVLQEAKPMWQKYAIPFISTCLKPLAKKELISYYEDVQLNIGAKGFLHAKLGHDELLPKPNKVMLDATAKIFQDALNKFPLAVTSHFVDAKFISVDNKGLFDKSKYKEVNQQIMASGGITPVVVTGESDGGSFAQANISIKTAAERIRQNQHNFAEMMKKYNRKLAELWRVGTGRIPEFVFNQIDLISDGNFKEEAFKLWQQGCISNTTLLEEHGYDVEQEFERRGDESKRNFENVFKPPLNTNTMSENSPGAPTKNQDKSKQDKNNSSTSKQPKPSNT